MPVNRVLHRLQRNSRSLLYILNLFSSITHNLLISDDYMTIMIWKKQYAQILLFSHIWLMASL